MSKKSKWQKQQTAAPRALPVAAPVAAFSPFIPPPEPPKRLTCTLERALLTNGRSTLVSLSMAPGGGA